MDNASFLTQLCAASFTIYIKFEQSMVSHSCFPLNFKRNLGYAFQLPWNAIHQSSMQTGWKIGHARHFSVSPKVAETGRAVSPGEAFISMKWTGSPCHRLIAKFLPFNFIKPLYHCKAHPLHLSKPTGSWSDGCKASKSHNFTCPGLAELTWFFMQLQFKIALQSRRKGFQGKNQ